MKIPRPREAKRLFRRARPPPIQATKLLLASLSAGLIFIVVLAIVFIPRALEHENQPPIPRITLVVSSASGRAWANVTEATIAAPLVEYNATVYRTIGTATVAIATLPTLNSVDGDLSFSDNDQNGRLTAGDSFEVVTREPGGTYTLQVWYRPVGKLVGLASWSG